MKMFFTCCIAALCASVLQAQPNNPYNQAGIDFVKSAQLIAKEIKTGSVKTADEATIKKLQAIIPSKTQMSPTLAGEVLRAVTKSPLPFSETLTASSLKPEVQREISLMLEHRIASDETKHQAWLTEKTDNLLKSVFDARDKELLLSLVAIQYHQGEFGDMGRIRCNTSVNGRVVDEGEGMECAGAAALVGFTIGYTFCGFYCGLGGAVVGFVAVAIGSIS